MPGKVRILVMSVILLTYVITSSGCIAAAFLVGAGAGAATAAVVDKESESKKDESK